jgi:hypothetical protein
VIVNGYSEFLFGPVLPNDVLIEKSLDLGRLGKMYVLRGRLVVLVLVDDVLTNPHALITDENRGTSDQFTNIILALVAE